MLSKLFDRLDESIGAGAGISTLRTQLGAIRQQAEAIEAQLRKAKARIKKLEAGAESHERSGEREELQDGAKKILQLLSCEGRPPSLEQMAKHLGLKRVEAQNHANTLVDKGLIELIGSDSSGSRYMLTDKGVAFVVENNLLL